MKSAPVMISALSLFAIAPASASTVVPLSHFSSIELRGGGHVVLKYGPTQRVALIAGSTQFTNLHMDRGEHGKLVIDACNRDCPRHYDLQIEIMTPDLDGAAVQGGGFIESQGPFPGQAEIAAAVQGGGRVDLRSIAAKSASAAVDGGGHVMVRARDALNAAVDGGGVIEYWGNPREVNQAVDGGGSIRKGG